MKKILALFLLLLLSASVCAGVKYVIASEAEKLDLFRGANLLSTRQNGEFIGWTVTNLKDGSLLYRMGVRDKDIIISINGNILGPDFTAREFFKLLSSEKDIVLGARGKNNTPKLFGVRFIKMEGASLTTEPPKNE